MMLKRVVALMCCFVGCYESRAAAAPIAYSEIVSGDLGDSLPAASVFALDLGLNTVTGTVHFDNQSGDADSFAFSVPGGAQLTQSHYTFLFSPTRDLTGADAIYLLEVGNGIGGPIIGNEVIDLLGASPVVLFGFTLPLGPGVYGLTNGLGKSLVGGFSADYTLSLQVDSTGNAVPEPTSLLLLGTGGLGLIARARKRKKQNA